MNPDVIIRTYQPSDHPGLRDVFFSNIPLYFNEAEWEDYDLFLKEDISPDCPYDVMIQNGQLIGAGGIALNEDGTVSLCWGMVRANLHRQGFGKALLEHRLTLSQQVYPDRSIVVDTSQHTYRFFERYGFDTNHIETNFWAKGLHLYKMKKLS